MAGQTGEANGVAMLNSFRRSLKIAGIGLLALGVQVQALEAQGSPGPDAHSCTPAGLRRPRRPQSSRQGAGLS